MSLIKNISFIIIGIIVLILLGIVNHNIIINKEWKELCNKRKQLKLDLTDYYMTYSKKIIGYCSGFDYYAEAGFRYYAEGKIFNSTQHDLDHFLTSIMVSIICNKETYIMSKVSNCDDLNKRIDHLNEDNKRYFETQSSYSKLNKNLWIVIGLLIGTILSNIIVVYFHK